MKRREFILLLGGATAWPLAARAQDRVKRVGVLMGSPGNSPEVQARLAAFQQGLEKLGWSEGRNIRIDYRFALSGPQMQALATELVALQPDVILAHSTPAAVALQRETRTIPVVFASIGNPIGFGLIASLARPGGNFTGLTTYEASIAGKWLAMLKEIAPSINRAALVGNPKTTNFDYYQRATEAAARSFTIELVRTPVEKATDVERGIGSFARASGGGLVVFLIRRPRRIAAQSLRRRPSTACRQFTRSAFLFRWAVSCPMAAIAPTSCDRPHLMSTASCAAPALPICRCRRRSSSKPLST